MAFDHIKEEFNEFKYKNGFMAFSVINLFINLDVTRKQRSSNNIVRKSDLNFFKFDSSKKKSYFLSTLISNNMSCHFYNSVAYCFVFTSNRVLVSQYFCV